MSLVLRSSEYSVSRREVGSKVDGDEAEDEDEDSLSVVERMMMVPMDGYRG